MHIARTQSQPVHGGEVAHRVTLVGVQDQFGLGGGPRGEVQQQRVGGLGVSVCNEGVGTGLGQPEILPACSCRPDTYPRVVARDLCEFRGMCAAGDHVADPAAHDAVVQISGGQQGGGRKCERGREPASEPNILGSPLMLCQSPFVNDETKNRIQKMKGLASTTIQRIPGTPRRA